MNPKIWFLFKDNHHIGPFTALEIKERFDRGEISSNIPVWKEGEPEWVPLANQSELASFVMPSEAFELPPLPPLPGEAFNHQLPKEPTDFVTERGESGDTENRENETLGLSKKLNDLSASLPGESVDAESFWQVDENIPEDEKNIPEFSDKENRHIVNATHARSPEELKNSLQEKLATVRSYLGENLQAEQLSTYSDGDVRFIKENEVIDDHYSSDDPIRSNQRFDGDPDPGMGKNKSDENLPNFMAEESVDYLGQYSHESDDLPENAEPTEGELAAIKASADHSNQLSEEYTNNNIQGHHDYVEEKYEETSEEDYIDPIDSEQMGHDVEMLKGHANKVVDCVDESVYNELDRPQSLTVSTTKKNEVSKDYEYDDFYEDEHSEEDYVDEFDEFDAPTESASKFGIKIIAIILLVAVLGISTSQLFFQNKKIPSLAKLSQHDARAMREIIDMDTNRFRYQFAVSDDKDKIIWFATNIPDQGILQIRIESREKSIASKQKIKVTAKTEILRYVGSFKELRFTEGVQMAEGEYHVTGTFKVGGIRSKVIQWLKQNTPLKKIKYFKYYRVEHKIDGKLYYSQKRGQQLKDHVALFWNRLKEEKSKPILIELQKWRTLKTLSEKVLQLFRQAMEMDRASVKSVGEEFQKNYATIIAPIFQTLTLDTQSLVQDNNNLLPEQVSRLEKLLDLQKVFGSFVAKNLDSLNNFKKLTKSIKQDLGNQALKRQESFATQVDAKIAELQRMLVAAGE